MKGLLMIRIVALCLLVVGCSSSVNNQVSSENIYSANAICSAYEKAGAPCEISLTQLIGNPNSYFGKQISFVGFLGGRAVPGTVFLGREQWLSHDTASAIHLSVDTEQLEQFRSADLQVKYTYVIVQGELSAVPRKGRPSIVVVPSRIVVARRISGFTKDEEVLIQEERIPE